MTELRVDFNRPVIVGREMEYIAEAIANAHISGDGPFTKKCHALLQGELGIPKVLLTTSCTHALEMAALLLDIQEGDEVIVPDFTFVSTINAFVLRGARPVFLDVRSDTLNPNWKRPSRPAQRSLSRSITQASAVKWTPLWKSPGNTVSLWWRITRTGCLASTKVNIWVRSA